MSTDDLEHEPVVGLPKELPAGEAILWQGSPDWWSLARHTFKIRWLAAYLLAMTALRVVFAAEEGSGALTSVITMLVAFVACIGLVAGFAFLHANATVYTITTKRVVMRFGIALPTAWNLPYRRLAAADLDLRDSGDGDILLQVTAPDRVRWVLFWPHAKGLVTTRPVLRSLKNADKVASTLHDAVSGWAARESGALVEAEEVGALPAPSRVPPSPDLSPAPSR